MLRVTTFGTSSRDSSSCWTFPAFPYWLSGSRLCWLLRRSASSCRNLIIMMKPAKNGYRDNLNAFLVDLTFTWNRGLLHNSLVRAIRIEVVGRSS